jgi:hypothetical protein
MTSPSDSFPAPVLDLPKSPESKWEQEHQAFLRLLPELLKTHPHQFVAIHQGQMVEAGSDLVEVALRAYGRYGYVPMYIDLVTERPLPPVRVPSPRLVPDEREA